MTDDELGGLDELLGSWVSDPDTAKARWQGKPHASTTGQAVATDETDLSGADECDERLDAERSPGFASEEGGTPEVNSTLGGAGQQSRGGHTPGHLEEEGRPPGESSGRTSGGGDADQEAEFNAVARQQAWIDRHVGHAPEFDWKQCPKETCKCHLPGWKTELKKRLERLEIASWRMMVGGMPDDAFVKCRTCGEMSTFARIALKDLPEGSCELCTDPQASQVRAAIQRGADVFAECPQITVAVTRSPR